MKNYSFALICCLAFTAVTSVSAAPNVNVELYMESLCPDCKALFLNVLYPVYKQLKPIMNLTFIPYGNALEHYAKKKWFFECQHGKEECYGNLLENCMLHYVKNQSIQVEYINCLEKLLPQHSGQACAKKLGQEKQWSKIQACMASPLGNALVHGAAVRTNNLKPSHQWVPWVLINGNHSKAVDSASIKFMKKAICNAYKGAKPQACRS